MRKILFLLLILISSSAFSMNSIFEAAKLEIEVNSVENENILCDFRYIITLSQKSQVDIYKLFLPFKENSRIKLSYVCKDSEVFVTYGYNSTGKGILLIASNKKDNVLEILFSDVQLPLKNSALDNGLMAYIDFPHFESEPGLSNIRDIQISDVSIDNTVLLNSNPKFKLLGRKKYLLSAINYSETTYFVIPKSKESYLSIFIVLLFITIIVGIFGAIKIIEGKNQSIAGLVSSSICLGVFVFLFIRKIIPDEFTQNIDMISVVGSGIGLCLGVLFNSAYNLISINAIKKQQNQSQAPIN